MSTSLPSPPAQESPPPFISAPVPSSLTVIAPAPQSLAATTSDSALLITPTPSTAPPPPLPTTATPPPAPHLSDDPAASATEAIRIAPPQAVVGASEGGGGLVDSGEVGKMDVEEAGPPSPPASAPVPSPPPTAASSNTSAPFLPLPPPPPPSQPAPAPVDPLVSLAIFQSDTERSGARTDVKAMEEGSHKAVRVSTILIMSERRGATS